MTNNNKKTASSKALKTETIGAKAEIQALERTQDISFWLSDFILGYLPYRKLQDKQITRSVKIGGIKKDLSITGHHELGLPYGKMPRILLLFFITQAKKGNKIVDMTSVSRFLKELGLPATGTYISRVKEELIKLNSLSYQYEERTENGYTSQRFNILNGDFFKISWLEKANKNIDNQELSFHKKAHSLDDFIQLDDKFYHYAKEHAFPVDTNVIKHLSKSSVAFEIYLFLTFNHNKSFFLSWEILKERFGTTYANNIEGRKTFKRRFIEQFKTVKLTYKANKSYLKEDGLQLIPSVPSVSKKKSEKAVKYAYEIFKETK